MSEGKIGAIILAAGNSSRLAQPKQLLQIGGETLVARAIAAARGAGCHPIIIVSGAVDLARDCGKGAQVSTPLAAASPEHCPQVVHNARWADGMGTSIHAGLAQVELRGVPLDAVIILACDQPRVTASILRQLIGKYSETRKPIVASRYAGTFGVPALFAHEKFRALRHLPDHAGAKRLIETEPEQVAAIDFPGGAVDIDTPVDWAALLSGPDPATLEK